MLKSVTFPLSLLAVMAAFVVFIVAQAPASSPAGGSNPRASNPCAAAPANPCAPRATNPCAPRAANPCAPRAANPCAPRAVNPCAAAPANPCAAR